MKVTGDKMFEGIDLEKVITKAAKLPSAKGVRTLRDLVIRRSPTKNYTTGHAYLGRSKITMTIGYEATVHRVVGTLLHELAHHICWDNGREWKDGSRNFARVCHDLHDEWNQRWGSRVCEVSVHLTGAYRGPSSKRDTTKSHVPGSKKMSVAANKSPKLVRDWWNPTYWAVMKRDLEGDLTIALGGALASDVQCRYVDPFDGDVQEQPDRAEFIEAWDRGKSRKAGRGTQYVFQLQASRIMLLHDALRWAVDDFEDQAASEAQARRLVTRLLDAC